jgi:hypothetical protein
MFASRLCAQGFLIPVNLAVLVRSMAWKVPLDPRCFNTG